VHLLAAPDKFRGTASALEIATAMADTARAAGWSTDIAPLSDGGEGLLECFGGANRHDIVTGPVGDPVDAPWRLDGTRAVIEMAAASGRDLVTGEQDALATSSIGTGQLIAIAVDAGAHDIIVGVGGSASTDGGRATVELLRAHAPLDGVHGPRVVVACDVRTGFVDAAPIFGPQKGASDDDVLELTARLTELAAEYADAFGVDVRHLPGAGAAGGLAGGLAALGARLEPGFALVATEIGLAGRIAAADLVLTGEGRVDASSAQGKVTGSVVALCDERGVPVTVVAGTVFAGPEVAALAARTVDLAATFGMERALQDVLDCVATATATILRGQEH
jgi:glycerate kinase